MKYITLLIAFLFPLAAWSHPYEVEWVPSGEYVNPTTGERGYVTSFVGPPDAKEVVLKAVLWLKPHVDCESLADPRYGTKALHILIDGKVSGLCTTKFAHFDATNGFCTNPTTYPDQNRIEWWVELPMGLRINNTTAVALHWLGVDMLPEGHDGISIGVLSWHLDFAAFRRASQPIFRECINTHLEE